MKRLPQNKPQKKNLGQQSMSRLQLHLDADVSFKALHKALLDKGHDVTRTPNDWMALNATDENQLLGAIAHQRCILTFNIRDFVALAETHPQHCGIILAAQNSWTLSTLIPALDQLLTTSQASDLTGQVRWLNGWRT
jgi:Domain of unknown function (DUF5615)